MSKLIFAALLMAILASAMGFIYTSQRPQQPEQERVLTTSTTQVKDRIPLPECIIDLDCGRLEDTGYSCWGDFIVRDTIIPQCMLEENGTAYCDILVERDIIDWCRPDEKCIENERVCHPRPTCFDGIRNQGETGIDCGGPCPPCPTCFDGIMNGDETGVDCGGSCQPCEISCESNESCGIPRWGQTYCLRDLTGQEHVYQDHFFFECVNPGQRTSHCKTHVSTRRTDYCGPLNPCYKGVCWDDEDSPYAYKHGGYYGPRLPSLTDQYVCRPQDNCWDMGRAYLTCVGQRCGFVAIPAH